MIAEVCEFWAYFAPAISETTFEGTYATVNGRKLISISCMRITLLKEKTSCLIVDIR